MIIRYLGMWSFMYDLFLECDGNSIISVLGKRLFKTEITVM